MSKTCVECKAKCCQYFCFEIDAPDSYEEFEDIRWYLCHHGVTVHIDDEGDWFIHIENRCNMLGDDYRCMIYDDRPLICRTYSAENCEHTSDSPEDFGYQHEFKTPQELDDYALKTLGQKTYEKEMVAGRAKLDGVTKKQMKENLLKTGLMPRRLKEVEKKGKKK